MSLASTPDGNCIFIFLLLYAPRPSSDLGVLISMRLAMYENLSRPSKAEMRKCIGLREISLAPKNITFSLCVEC